MIEIDVRPARLDDDKEIVDLLALAVGDRGRGPALESASRHYRTDRDARLLVAFAAHRPVGIAGYAVADSIVTLRHIATAESHRRRGVGTQLLTEVIRSVPSAAMVEAETDLDAVGFYVAFGFAAVSLGEKYPGVERFRMRYRPSPEPWIGGGDRDCRDDESAL